MGTVQLYRQFFFSAVISDHSNYFNEWRSTRDADGFPNWLTGYLEIISVGLVLGTFEMNYSAGVMIGFVQDMYQIEHKIPLGCRESHAMYQKVFTTDHRLRYK